MNEQIVDKIHWNFRVGSRWSAVSYNIYCPSMLWFAAKFNQLWEDRLQCHELSNVHPPSRLNKWTESTALGKFWRRRVAGHPRCGEEQQERTEDFLSFFEFILRAFSSNVRDIYHTLPLYDLLFPWIKQHTMWRCREACDLRVPGYCMAFYV